MADKKQRRLNRYIRQFNKSLAQDAFLGLNRFRVAQKARFDDGNLILRIYLIEFVDTKTSESKQIVVSNYDYSRQIFWGMNDFIVSIRQKEGW